MGIRPQYPPNADGYSIVEADSAADALEKVLAGTIQAVVGGQTYTYTMGEGSVGSQASDHKPFLFDGGTLRLEDLAASSSANDWDHNDHFWLAAVVPVASTSTATPTVSIRLGANIEQGDSNFGWFIVHRSNGNGTLTVNYAAPSGNVEVGTDEDGLSDGAGSVTFAAGQVDAVLFFESRNVVEESSENDVTLQLITTTTGAFILDTLATFATADLDAGFEVDADEAPRMDRATTWHNLLSNPNFFTDDAEALVDTINEFVSFLNVETHRLSRAERRVIQNIIDGVYTNSYLQWVDRGNELRNMAIAVMDANTRQPWSYAGPFCREFQTPQELTAFINARLAELTSPDYQTRAAATNALRLLAENIVREGDLTQMEIMGTLLYTAYNQSTSPELRDRLDIYVFPSLFPRDRDRMLYIAVHAAGELMRRMPTNSPFWD